MTPLESLVAAGSKLWLDSVDPDLVKDNRKYGATGATSNPVIISDLVKTGRFDDELTELMKKGLDDESVAWELTDRLVRRAQAVFEPVWEQTEGDDGYVSFELDPLIDDLDSPLSHEERVRRYVELGKTWSAGHTNRMIKVPATPAGLDALEDLAAAGVTLNVTLIFTQRQYRAARDAICRGAQKRDTLEKFKSVYSIFVSRIDVYVKKHVPELSEAAQRQLAVVNAKRLWFDNRDFWTARDLPLKQEIVFASTGTKDPDDPPDRFVAAFVGSDILTNPPATNAAIQQMEGRSYTRTVEEMPPQEILDEIDAKVDFRKLEDVLMEEGLKKFADPQKALLRLIGEKRQSLLAAR